MGMQNGMKAAEAVAFKQQEKLASQHYDTGRQVLNLGGAAPTAPKNNMRPGA